MAAIPGMKERTMVINSLSKTYSVTGWRVGYVLAPVELTRAVRKVHDFLTVGAPAPLQEAGTVAMRLGDDYYEGLASSYRQKRDLLLGGLEEAGFSVFRPSGAYYIMTGIEPFGPLDDLRFCDFLVREIGVAAVPGSSFYSMPGPGSRQVRFCFCKQESTLEEAISRLLRLRESSLLAEMRRMGS